jgi:colicin import membrane protein
MSERVERERDGGGRLNGMILLSLMLHAVVLILLFFTPSFPSPKLTFGPVYTVSLVNFSGNVLQRKSETAAAKELMQAARSETVLKKRLEPEPVIPIRSLESRRKQDQNLEKAMEEIRKRAAASAATPKPQTKAGSDTKAMPEAKAGPASSLPAGDADMNDKMGTYYTTIWSRIKGKWAFPGLLPGDVLETVIDVTILRSGAVTAMNIEKRSGNRYFDESVLMAIRKASPFPPLPAWISEGSLDVGIRFHSSELKS